MKGVKINDGNGQKHLEGELRSLATTMLLIIRIISTVVHRLEGKVPLFAEFVHSEEQSLRITYVFNRLLN